MSASSDRERVESSIAASAALLFNLLPSLTALSDKERYQRLFDHLWTAFLTAREALRNKYPLPDPSPN